MRKSNSALNQMYNHPEVSCLRQWSKIVLCGGTQEEKAHVTTCTQNTLCFLSNLWVRSFLARGDDILYLIVTITYCVIRIYGVSCKHLETTCGKVAP